MPSLAVIYLSYYSEPHFARFVEALKKTTYPHAKLLVIVVDNLHPAHGSSAPFMQAYLNREKEAGALLPEIVILPQDTNRGFSGGVNIGIRRALECGAEYVFLHNQDGFLAPDALETLVVSFKADERIGAVQALMKYPETDRVNCAGGVFHFLGFGYAHHILPAASGLLSLSIGYASGGAVLLRADVLRHYGLWDEDYFLYHEDLEYSLRLKTLGYRTVLAPHAVFYHQYEFSRNKNKWFFMERNRWGLLLTYYKVPTLLILAPSLIVAEIGVWILAIIQGWSREKFRATAYWFSFNHLRLWLRKRRIVQQQRRVGDRELLLSAVSEISLENTASRSSFFAQLANPILKGIFWMVRMLVRW